MMVKMRRLQRLAHGLGLIEILVAIAIGLFLVASGATLVLNQLAEQRRLLLESRLNQDLRAVADLIARDLKRSGYWGAAQDGVWRGDDTAPAANPYIGVYPATGSAALLGYAYSRDTTEDNAVANQERFGLRLNANTQALELRLGGAAIAPASGDQWQALTDPSLTRITRWAVQTQTRPVDLLAHCANPACPAGSTNCPPRLLQRTVSIELDATDSRDTNVRFSLRSRVNLRNDELQGACPATAATGT